MYIRFPAIRVAQTKREHCSVLVLYLCEEAFPGCVDLLHKVALQFGYECHGKHEPAAVCTR